MKSAVSIFISKEQDPISNLAFEEGLFETLEKGTFCLFLYVNRDAVIIGKNQNPWREAAIETLLAAGTPLLRRISGGGTVFHDPGNLNFSFICDKDKFDKKENLSLIVRALKSLDIEAEMNDRGDILCRGAKISGNAMRFSRGRALHHGTLLVKSNLSHLSSCLKGLKNDISSHAVASVSSKVANIDEFVPGIEIERVIEEIINTYSEHFTGNSEGLRLIERNPRDLFSDDYIDELSQKYRSWDWNYGSSPAFTIEVELGNGKLVNGKRDRKLKLSVKKGIITDIISVATEEAAPGFDLLKGRAFDLKGFKKLIADKGVLNGSK